MPTVRLAGITMGVGERDVPFYLRAGYSLVEEAKAVEKLPSPEAPAPVAPPAEAPAVETQPEPEPTPEPTPEPEAAPVVEEAKAVEDKPKRASHAKVG